MAPIDTTFQTYQAEGLREDLADIIYDISPTDTPFMSNGGRTSASATLHEWQTDALDAPDTANAVVEGDDITQFPAKSPTVRVGNYTQISRKLCLVSGTLDVVDKSGRATESAYQMAKRAAELKRDMEAMSLENLAGDAGSASTARISAGLGAWVQDDTSRAGDGTPSGHTTGVPGATAGDGTVRPIDEEFLKTAAAGVWDRGGTLKMLMAGPINKQNISLFAGVATKTYFQSAVEAAAIIGAADVYVSDFGVLSIVPNRFQRERDVWLLDPEMYSFAFLRPFQTIQLATTGDADKKMMLAEWTLRVNNEAGLGVIADLDAVIQ